MLVFLVNKKYSYCLSGRLWRVFWSGGRARFYAYKKILLGRESRFVRKIKGELMARRGGAWTLRANATWALRARKMRKERLRS